MVVRTSRRQVELEAQRITCGISSKFVPEPNIDEVQSNLLVGLKQFDHAVRQWYFNKTRKQTPPPIINDDAQKSYQSQWPLRWPSCNADETTGTFVNRRGLGLSYEPLVGPIGQILALHGAGNCHEHD